MAPKSLYVVDDAGSRLLCVGLIMWRETRILAGITQHNQSDGGGGTIEE